jgi:NAD-dependent deacetylase
MSAGGRDALPPEVAGLLADALARPGRVVCLTGAGVSAASGIPTFRGPEGYWRVGSAVYRPEELATRAAFHRDPAEVWAWYLYRLGVCRAAAPNAAHEALVRLERDLGTRFLLVTQNVDGLHQRAGSRRVFAVHGHLEQVRCSQECTPALRALPAGVGTKQAGEPLTVEERAALTCDACGAWLRPHVLWFDETYDEARFRFESTLAAARDAALLVTVGTSGATTLPALAVEEAVRAGAALVDCNPEDNPFGMLADRLERGARVRAPAAAVLPDLAAHVSRCLP